MRRGWIGSAVLLAAVALIVLRPSGAERRQTAESDGPGQAMALITRVIDGDTVEARIGGETEDVRYIGVDTPETVKPGAPVECFGKRASAFNHRLVEGRRARLVFGVEQRDKYGRLLAYVRVGGKLVNAELARRGLAEPLTIPPNDRLAPLFERLALGAARAGRGLWSACSP